jgi:hypothetical protein
VGEGVTSPAQDESLREPRRPRNLVVVRAGDASLHSQWLIGADVADFDLIVSYYGDDPASFRAPRENRVDCKGGKWNGVATLFAQRPELLDHYDYVWLPDDDLETDARTIAGLFATMAHHDLALAQPSLTLDSHYTYIAYLSSRTFALRYATAIEIMAPCLSAGLLRRVLPLIADSPSGWGLDFVWTRLAADNRRKSAILDQWPVRHTRAPRSGSLYAAMASEGRSAWDDFAAMRRRFGRLKPFPLVYEAIDARGRAWRDPRAIGVRMTVDYLVDRSRIAHYSTAKTNILPLLRRQLGYAVDLSQLSASDRFAADAKIATR